MICRNCNTENMDNAPFCQKCGMPFQPNNGAMQQPEQKGLSIASMVLGIVGLLAWCIPILGYPVTIIGLVLGIIGIKKGGKGMAIAGMVLSGISLIATVINSALGAYMAVNGML